MLAINEINDAADDTVVSQQCFQYDHLRRLTEAWTTTATQCQSAPTQAAVQGPDPYCHSYTYDKTGNRLTDTVHQPTGDTTRDYTTPAAGTSQPHTLTRRATRGGGPAVDYTYDTAGNLLTRTGAGLNDTHTWDAEGHLTALTTTSGAHTYIYDTGGERLIADDPAAVTAYLGDIELRREKATGTVVAVVVHCAMMCLGHGPRGALKAGWRCALSSIQCSTEPNPGPPGARRLRRGRCRRCTQQA